MENLGIDPGQVCARDPGRLVFFIALLLSELVFLFEQTLATFLWNQILHAAGIDSIPTRQLCFVEDTPVALAMAASGYGIALARAPTTDNLTGKLGLESCEHVAGLKSSEAYYLIYQNIDSLSSAATAFRDWLLAEVKS